MRRCSATAGACKQVGRRNGGYEGVTVEKAYQKSVGVTAATCIGGVAIVPLASGAGMSADLRFPDS
jgi:hypothetical protein